MQCLNYSGQESKKQIVVYDSDTPVTLKQDQGHQTLSDNVNPKEGYNHAKFERSSLMVSEKKRTLKGCFFSNEEMCQLSPLNICKKLYIKKF